MPDYGFICNLDDKEVKTLNDAKDKLCVSVPIKSSSGGEEKNPLIASTTEIKSGTILTWSDIINVYIVDANKAKSEAYEIKFGQTLKVKDKKVTVEDDSASPRYGFRFATDVGGNLEVHQKFGSAADASFTTKWYDSDTYDITWDPIFNVWLKSNSGVKFAVKFTETLTQVIYLNEEGEWSLTGPHAFAASTVLSISQGHGGYFITQPHNSNGGGGARLMALVAGSSKNRKAISVALGPAVLEGYVDITTFEVGVNVSVIGIEFGSLYGNLKDGVVLHVNLIAASGKVTLYLKAKTQVWLKINLKLLVGGDFDKDQKILDL